MQKCRSSTEKKKALDGFAAVIQNEHKKMAEKPIKKKKIKPTIESSSSSSDSEMSVNYLHRPIVRKKTKYAKAVNRPRVYSIESSDDSVSTISKVSATRKFAKIVKLILLKNIRKRPVLLRIQLEQALT